MVSTSHSDASGSRVPGRSRNPYVAAAIIFAVAGAVRALHVSDVRNSPFHADGHIHMFDSEFYDQQARRIAAGDLWGDEVYFLAPLYPFTLALCYWLFSGSVSAAMYVQAVWGALTCVLIYAAGRRVAGHAAGTVAGLTAAFYGMFIFQDGLILGTHLVTFLNVAAMLVLLRAGRGRSIALWVVGGVLLGLCMVVHGTALLLLPAVVVWIFVGVPASGLRARMVRSAVVFLGAAACVVPVTIRNYVVGRDWVLLTSNAGLNFYIGNNAEATGSYMHFWFDDLPGATLGWHLERIPRQETAPRPSEISRALRNRALAAVKADPLRELKLLVKKSALFFNAVEVGINDQFYFYERFSHVLRRPLVTFGVLAPIGLTGLVCSLPRRRTYVLVYLWLTVQVVAFTLMFVLGRYRLVAVACLMILAGAQVVWWFERLRAGQYRVVALSGIPLVLFSILVHVPVAGFSRERGFGEQYRLLGMRYRKLDRDPEAIECFNKALQYDFAPWDETKRRADCLDLLSKSYGRQQQWYDLIDAGRRALELMDRLPQTDTIRQRRQMIRNRIEHARRKLSLLRGRTVGEKRAGGVGGLEPLSVCTIKPGWASINCGAKISPGAQGATSLTRRVGYNPWAYDHHH